MIDLPDITFLIIVRSDSIERLENILLVRDYITSSFKTSTIVMECAAYYNGLLAKLLENTVSYTFQEDCDPVLFRTRYLNKMIKAANTPFVAVWDADVIAPVSQVSDAISLLRNNHADFVYPYERFIDTTPILRKLFIQAKGIEILERNVDKMKDMYSPNPVGGAFLANTKSYIDSGCENENFYGWGMEDGERLYRWESMGYKIKRVPGPLFHLSHPRGQNSAFHDADQQIIKRKEVMRAKRNRPVRDNIAKT